MNFKDATIRDLEENPLRLRLLYKRKTCPHLRQRYKVRPVSTTDFLDEGPPTPSDRATYVFCVDCGSRVA